MATAQSLLTQVNSAIESLLTAMADEATQEYSYNGRTWKRADFPTALDSLRRLRTELQTEVAQSSRSVVRVGRLSRPR